MCFYVEPSYHQRTSKSHAAQQYFSLSIQNEAIEATRTSTKNQKKKMIEKNRNVWIEWDGWMCAWRQQHLSPCAETVSLSGNGNIIIIKYLLVFYDITIII